MIVDMRGLSFLPGRAAPRGWGSRWTFAFCALGAVAASCGERAHSQQGAGPLATVADDTRHPSTAPARALNRDGKNAAVAPMPARGGNPHPPDPSGARSTGVAAALALAPGSSTSVGAADDGSLEGGVQLPKAGPGFRHNDRRPDQARYGTVELVQALIRAAKAAEADGLPLMINDLGLSEGGPIAQHGSHQAGRDVDILFFYRDRKGSPYPSIGVPVEPDGTGVDYRDLSDPSDDVPLRFDAERTWRFCQALLEVAYDHIQRIFIVEHVRDRLLKAAKRLGAPARIVQRFGQITCQPGTPHDDHMHVRFYCTPQDMAAGCLDKPPTYPWRRAALSALDLKPALYRGRPSAKQRRARAARTTTAEQAKNRATRRYGKFHREVRAFLERRKSWAKKTSPPRPFCR